MNKIVLVGLLFVASAMAQFDLPMVMDIGGFSPDTYRLNHEVIAVGPFTQPRNQTINFEWTTQEYSIHGVRIRGTDPRYDSVSVTVRVLERKRFHIEVNVINTSFALFWAEPMGFEDIIPAKEKVEQPAATL